MPFTLLPDRSVGDELRRLAIRQLELAAADLRAEPLAEAPHQRLHEARRHLKKARALLHLAQPAFPASARRVDRRLRDAGRMLAPLADADALVRLLDVLAARRPGVAGRDLDAVLRPLLEARRDQLARGMTAAGGRAAAGAAIDAARHRVEGWSVRRHGFAAVRRGLRRSVRRARRDASRAGRRPTAPNYHAWRQRVKDLWLHVRLLARRTGGQLTVLETRLEALDGVLGQYHDCTLLRDVLASRPAGTDPRDAALCLRAIRAYQQDLRRAALPLAVDVHDDSPGAFVGHVRRLWRATSAAGATAAPSAIPWRAVA